MKDAAIFMFALASLIGSLAALFSQSVKLWKTITANKTAAVSHKVTEKKPSPFREPTVWVCFACIFFSYIQLFCMMFFSVHAATSRDIAQVGMIVVTILVGFNTIGVTVRRVYGA